MVRDTWHIVSGSRGATCHVQYDSNMSSNGTYERHVASCHWVEIYVRWIRDEVKSKSTNGKLTWGMRTILLTQLDPTGWNGEKRGKKEREEGREGF